MRALAPNLIVLAFCIGTAVAQNSSAGQPLVGADAYEIYSLLIPQQESYGFAKGTLVVQEETLTNRDVSCACLSSETTRRFGGAISDYRRSQTKKWLLNRHFVIEKPYEIVNEQTLGLLRGHGSERWDAYYDHYPKSGGYIFMSAVGFNKNKTLAIVYMGSICGGLCGQAQFHLLEKVRGHWKEVPAATCVVVS
jgi:hypothetical protein